MLDQSLKSRLLPHERILWSGRPKQGIVFQPRDILVIPFSVLWCAFAIFWTVMAFSANAPFFFPLVGGIFVCVGIFMVFGRLLFDAWVRKGMEYAVTDRRIIILQTRPVGKFSTVALERMPDLQLTERQDGRGTIRFGAQAPFFGHSGFAIWIPSLDPVPQFIAIDNVAGVFQTVQRAAEQRGQN